MSAISAPVVCVDLEGGLGNQLFQFAAGFALARRRKAPLAYSPDGENIHGSSLERLDLPWEEIGAFRLVPTRRKIRHYISALVGGPATLNEVQQPSFHYWAGLEDPTTLPTRIMLRGHWQSERYFLDVAQGVREAIAIERFLPNSAAADDLRVAAVHVRRGDFAASPEILEVHGLLQRRYYDRARAVIEGTVCPDLYRVFSDDPEAAAAMLEGWGNIEIMARGDQLTDLALMSQCSAFITANSSFSWWAAWLASSSRSGVQVVAPRQWFADETLRRFNTADLFPREWILV